MGKFFRRRRYGALTILGVILLLGALMAVGFYMWQRDTKSSEETVLPQTLQEDELTGEAQEEMVVQSPEPAPVFNERQLQGVIDGWGGELSGVASVVVADDKGHVLAAHNADKVYFAASLYKLYVAYFGYIQVDGGVADPSQLYVGSRTRAQCLDAMIRESDSPCAEKMWVELGKQSLTDLLKERGISNTSMTNISTTAGDVAQILALFASGEGLSEESQVAFLASAKDQVFRDALNKGFSDSLIVYNKIGFNGLKEYHDAAIVELPDGRKFIITVLTENVGTRNIAELGRRVEAILLPSS